MDINKLLSIPRTKNINNAKNKYSKSVFNRK